MVAIILTIIGAIGFVCSTFAGGVYFYWKLKDRRVKPIEEHQSQFKENWEGNQIMGKIFTGTITKVTCYPPKSRVGKLKRYLLFDTGRIDVTLSLQPPVPNHFWDECAELVEQEDVSVEHYDVIEKNKQSYIRLEISRLDSEYFEEVLNVPIGVIDKFQMDQKNT